MCCSGTAKVDIVYLIKFLRCSQKLRVCVVFAQNNIAVEGKADKLSFYHFLVKNGVGKYDKPAAE